MASKRRGNGEGSIFRENGREGWVGLVTLPDGRRRKFTGKTRNDVSRKIGNAVREIQRGVPIGDGRQTVGEYLTDWLQKIQTSVRPRTYDAYKLCVKRVHPYIGLVRMALLSPADLQSSYANLLAGNPAAHSDPLARRSVEQVHTVLHRAFRHAVQWGILGRNPTEAVTVPRPSRREMQTLTSDQVQQLFEASGDDRLAGLWVLLVNTGVRLGEALGLKWGDVDLAIGRLAIRRALQRQSGKGLVLVEPKTAKSRRTVYLASNAVISLRQHRRRQVEERLAAGPLWQDNDFVFAKEDGRPMEPGWVTVLFHRALERADLPQVRVHDLRHTAATLLLSRGVHPKVVQEMLGHSTIGLTLDTYSHVAPAMHAEAAAQMDALFLAGQHA